MSYLPINNSIIYLLTDTARAGENDVSNVYVDCCIFDNLRAYCIRNLTIFTLYRYQANFSNFKIPYDDDKTIIDMTNRLMFEYHRQDS